MAPEEFKIKMQEIKDNRYIDEEDTHIAMDELMTKILISLGYGEGVKIFNDTPKWYA